jgi:arylsulfatase A-like enzyme
MRTRLLSSLLVTLCLLGYASTSFGAPPRPNVVFILADDLGVNDLSLYGSKFHETPSIDALARRGMKFNRAYSASPLCSPTRSSILTGLYPSRIGITAPDCHLPKEVLDKHLVAAAPPAQKALAAESLTRLKTDHYTLAKAFKADGYATGHFGKWHLGPDPYSPLQQGFDVDIPHTPAPSPLGKGFFYPFPVWKGHGKPGDNLEDLVADEAVKFIEQHKDEPFFLNYWAFEVHSPWQAKAKQIDKYRAKADPASLQRNPVYAGMVETLDEVVGRLVAALDKAGVLERTIIVFTSDNGPYFIPNQEHMPAEFHKVPVTSAQPLRAGKGTIYEAGTRVPLVVIWPGKVKPGSESSALVQSTDFFPTFADMLGWKLPADVRFDGVSQRPALERNENAREEIYCHFPHVQARGEYERMPAPTPATPASSVRQGDWKLIRFYCDKPDQTDRYELYNLADDPGERHDLAAAQPERVKQLSVRLDAFLKDTAAVVPKPNPACNPNAKPIKAKATGSQKGKAAVVPKETP